VQVSHFRGPNGRVLPKGNITVYLERFVDVKIPSSVEGGTGEWPDPLVPQVDRYDHEKRNAFPFRLVHGRNQPLWIEVYIPPSTDPGSYHGEVQISIAGDPKIRVPVDLEVWNFVLPSTSSLVTSFGFSGTRALNQHYGKYTNDDQLYALTGLYRKAALWHRISIHGGSGVPPAVSLSNGQVRLNWDAFDRELAPALDGRMFSDDEPLYGAKATSVAVRTAPSLKTSGQQIQYWQRVAEHFREKGWIDRLFNYLWDEPKPSEYDAMIRLGKAVHQADPQLRNLVTAPLRREWAGVVDIWTPLINCFEHREGHFSDYCDTTVGRTAYDQELANGKNLWWYQACGSHGCNIVGGDYFRGWPNYAIDLDAAGNRILEWLTWKYNIQGELYFNTDEAFSQTANPWHNVYLFGGNGDGTLFYPGTPATIGGTTHIPVESIRLKLIREGLEDYEYLTMFEKAAGREVVSRLVDSLVRNTHNFDHDPAKLYGLRQSIGQELNRLSANSQN
jgi:hypothetical protein